MTLLIIDIDGTLTSQDGKNINWDLVKHLMEEKQSAESRGEEFTVAFATASKSGKNLKSAYVDCMNKDQKSPEDLFLLALIEQSAIFLAVKKDESIDWGKDIRQLETSPLFSQKDNKVENSPEANYCLKSIHEPKKFTDLLGEHKEHIVIYGNDFHDQALRSQIETLGYKTLLIDAAISSQERAFVDKNDSLVVGMVETEEYEAEPGFVKEEYQENFRDPDQSLKVIISKLSKVKDNQFLTWEMPGDKIDPISVKNMNPSSRDKDFSHS